MFLDWDRFQHSQNGSGSRTTKSRRGPMQIRIHNTAQKGSNLALIASYLTKNALKVLLMPCMFTGDAASSAVVSESNNLSMSDSLSSVVSRLPFVVLSNGLSLSSPLPYPSHVRNFCCTLEFLTTVPQNPSPSVSTSVKSVTVRPYSGSAGVIGCFLSLLPRVGSDRQ